MPKEFYFPDVKEPHIHVHKGGITFTGTSHNHRNLVSGDKVYAGVVKELVEELQELGDERSLEIVQWIKDNIQ